ncbi:serine hydrolase domain-containing protein [Brevibacterium litoralis]|uniref:serine hydrolase domain-containing protein n=1 Tax=Brevibacterium litoralis TaxID=3138935 RepID=UPI0032EEC750
MSHLPASLVQQLDTWFEGVDVKAPGAGFAVFDRTGVLFHAGTGTFDTAPGAEAAAADYLAGAGGRLGVGRVHGTAPTARTAARICSMSKSFLIVALLVLVERGRVDLEAPVSRYVPEFTDPVVDGETVPVTVRMICSNCSGLPEDNAWADFHLGLDHAAVRDLVARGLRFSEVPDTSYQYSNFAFGLVGMVLENVTGERYQDFVTREVIAPLGLTHTRYEWRDFEPGTELMLGFTSFDEGASWIHRPYVETGILGAAGSLWSTAEDIARWVGWLSAAFAPAEEPAQSASDGQLSSELQGASGAGEGILSRRMRRRMQRIHTPIHSMQERMVKDGLFDGIGYGLGLVIEMDSRFGTIAQHSGGLPGFSTNMRWHCDSGLGVYTYVNSEGRPAARWAESILSTVLRALEVPARTVDLWPETAAAARRIDSLLHAMADGSDTDGGGSFADLSDIAAPNLFSDVPVEVRDSRAVHAFAQAGGVTQGAPEAEASFADRLLWCVSAADLVWRVPGKDADLQVRIEIAEVPALGAAPANPLQRVVIEPLGKENQGLPTGRDKVVRHFVPRLPG